MMGLWGFFKKLAPTEAAQPALPTVENPPVFKERLVTRAELASLSDEASVVVESSRGDGKKTYMIGVPSVLREALGDASPKKPRRRQSRPRRTRSHNFMGVAGESYRQPALSGLLSAGGPYLATLVPEPTNPHDKKAVKVIVNGQHVGYLKRETARQFGQAIATAEAPVQCPATIYPPEPPNTNVAVTLDFSTVYALVEGDDESDREDEDEGEDDREIES